MATYRITNPAPVAFAVVVPPNDLLCGFASTEAAAMAEALAAVDTDATDDDGKRLAPDADDLVTYEVFDGVEVYEDGEEEPLRLLQTKKGLYPVPSDWRV